MTVGGRSPQWALVGLRTGAEVYGALPAQAGGRVREFLNAVGPQLALAHATTEDVEHGAEVPSLLVALEHVTYVQPWGTAAVPAFSLAAEAARRTPIEVTVVLTTRVTISGLLVALYDVDLVALLQQPGELFLEFSRATLSTPAGDSRTADSMLVNRQHIMLARSPTQRLGR